MTSRRDDKRGNNEFGDEPDSQYNAKVEARHTKETRAKTEQGQRGYGSRGVGESHQTDRG